MFIQQLLVPAVALFGVAIGKLSPIQFGSSMDGFILQA